jgi:hypothetical protein
VPYDYIQKDAKCLSDKSRLESEREDRQVEINIAVQQRLAVRTFTLGTIYDGKHYWSNYRDFLNLARRQPS